MENINEELFKFIEDHSKDDPKSLLLSHHAKDLPFSLSFAALQIEARKKNGHKIPFFLKNRYFLFPDAISSEQATDERVAKYHSTLAGSHKKILDLTAGLGIDAMTNALNGNDVTACEINTQKAMALRHNAEHLNLHNFEVHNIDCIEFLRNNKKHFDLVYIDPARRDSNNNRTYSLADCEPDVLKLMPLIFEATDCFMIKVSPLLDISKLIKEINNLEKIFAICVKGECKELLLKVTAEASFSGYEVIDLDYEGIISDIEFSSEEISKEDPMKMIDCSEDEVSYKYLYEPNAGVMKLPRRSTLSLHYDGLYGVGKNTSLFMSNEFYDDFPGRILRIERFIDKKDLKSLKDARFNVVTRNYPMKAEELRKKLKVKEGMDRFIYAFRTGRNDKPVLCIASKIK